MRRAEPRTNSENRAALRNRTLAGLLRWRADTTGDEPAFYHKQDGSWIPWTWKDYWQRARSAAVGLYRAGIRPGDRVLLLVPDVEPAVASFFGLWSLGAVPTIVGLPYRFSDVDEFMRQLEDTARRFESKALVLSAAFEPFAARAREGLLVLVAEELADADPGAQLPDPDAASGAALIQLTSGSTGRPRGVVVSHERLLLHMASMSEALPVVRRPGMRAVSWLPLHHDMGLIGGLLFPLFNGFPLHLLSPVDFRADPFCWLEEISRVGGGISPAPPSAYAICAKLGQRAQQAKLDLGSWDCAMVGAEPISASTLRAFSEAFAPCGFRPEAFFPVYGLAEAVVAVTFPELLAPTRFETVGRSELEQAQRAVPCGSGPGAIEVVGVGRPIPGSEVRVVDEQGNDLPDRTIGEILVASTSMMEGYFQEPEATAASFDGPWLRTGDLGYLVDQDLFVTGRKKDLIIKGGLKLMPALIEEIVSSLDGVRAGCVAAVGIYSEQRSTELACVVAESRLEPSAHAPLVRAVREALAKRGMAIDRIVLVPPGALPKTTSGKIIRAAVRSSLLSGTEAMPVGSM